MDSNTLNSIGNSLDQYIRSMKQRVDDMKREANNVESETRNLKKRLLAEVTALSSTDPLQDGAAKMAERHYEHEQRNGQQQAKELRDAVGAIERNISEAESVYSEIRKYESAMRDTETNARAYISRAQEVMSRG